MKAKIDYNTIPIEVRRSKKRRKTVNAYLQKGKMIVLAPQKISEKELNETIASFKEKFKKAAIREELNLEKNLHPIAQRLNREYFDGELKFKSIEYVTNHNSIYGVCDIQKKEIRISHLVAAMPSWVRDYVIVHELAHLVHPNHSKRFWKLVNRYPLTERARGFLIAKGLEESEEKCDDLTPQADAVDVQDESIESVNPSLSDPKIFQQEFKYDDLQRPPLEL